ncbi:beta-carotene hydroxylase [Fretibacter rubidus]|uniref:beta-carotene hydroxylase n=1 Tax=Fretibacter rubidus TaxID=570162 RepID=UPI00352B84F1
MIINIAIIIASVIFMEVFAILFHKYYMHGERGWAWHESHHRHTEGPFERNDLYAVCFSFIAAALFIAGTLWWSPLWYIGVGFTVYGVLYAIVHDGLVHQRWPFHYTPSKRLLWGYPHRLVLAHRMHHHVTTREGAVSFGFLWAEKPDRLKAQLKNPAG